MDLGKLVFRFTRQPPYFGRGGAIEESENDFEKVLRFGGKGGGIGREGSAGKLSFPSLVSTNLTDLILVNLMLCLSGSIVSEGPSITILDSTALLDSKALLD